MEWHSVRPDYAAKAIVSKTLARKIRSLENWYLLGGLLTAVVVGVGVLFFFPALFDEERNWLVPVLAAAGISFGVLLQTIRRSTDLPKCPSCGQDWTIHEGKTVPLAQQMLTWDRCPGCGAIMNDGLLQMAVKNHAQNPKPKK